MSDAYIGEIRMFAGNYATWGWELCNGQLLPINQYEALFSLIGTTYGGDGVNTFALPNLQGRVPIGVGNNYTLGQAGGTELSQLTVTQLPAHSHIAYVDSNQSSQQSPAGHVWGLSAFNQYSTSAPDSDMNQSAIGAVGGNQAHNNMMPSSVINFMICVQGNYPSES